MSRRTALVLLFCAALCASAFAAPPQWVEVKSPHFKLITNSSDKQGRRILDQFERMRWLFQTMFPSLKVDPPQPIVVIAVRDARDMRDLEPAAYLAKGMITLAGMFMSTPDRNYVLLRLDVEGEHPYETIYHEYTHLQFREVGWLPLWLNEGFAEFLQNTEFRDKDVIYGEPSIDDLNYLRQNSLLPLSTLLMVDHNSPYYHQENKASVFYAESWALTHYLEITDKQNGTHRLPDYVSLVQRHQDSITAATKAFGDLNKLQAELGSYISAARYMSVKLPATAAPIDESTYRSRPIPLTDADAQRADMLVGVGRTADAQTLLDAVMKTDPNNPLADNAMGNLTRRNGDFAAARDWFEKAAVNSPDDFEVNYNFATSAMRSGHFNDPQVEASLRAALRMKPDYAPVYDQLAQLLALLHTHADEQDTMYKRAMELDPANLIYKLNAASALMVQSRYDDAAALLQAALKVPGSPNEMAMVKNRLQQVQSIRDLGARPGQMVTSSPTGVVDLASADGVSADSVVDFVKPPKHPTEPAAGAKHAVTGVIRNVQCSSLAEIEFNVVADKVTDKKPVSVYSNNYFKLDLTALGFTPPGDMNPCHSFEGMKARVQYAESSDKTVDGQVIAVELHK